MPASKGQKGRKIGRNKPACESYRREDRRAKNGVLRQVRHLKRLEKFAQRRARFAVPGRIMIGQDAPAASV